MMEEEPTKIYTKEQNLYEAKFREEKRLMLRGLALFVIYKYNLI